MNIAENYQNLRKEIPKNVSIVVACKTRTPEEIAKVVGAGADILGENYVQEAEELYSILGEKASRLKWHLLGHLQRNKINRALRIFDVVQTIDSKEIAAGLSERAERAGKIVSVYMEVNIGAEDSKTGVKPEYREVKTLAEEISQLKHLRLEGLMTMAPFLRNPEDYRPYFRKMKKIFDEIKSLNLPEVDMKYLSMGMSDSYRVAIEEGSNMVRLGAVIFK